MVATAPALMKATSEQTLKDNANKECAQQVRNVVFLLSIQSMSRKASTTVPQAAIRPADIGGIHTQLDLGTTQGSPVMVTFTAGESVHRLDALPWEVAVSHTSYYTPITLHASPLEEDTVPT